jgi:hypothetical protein
MKEDSIEGIYNTPKNCADGKWYQLVSDIYLIVTE